MSRLTEDRSEKIFEILKQVKRIETQEPRWLDDDVLTSFLNKQEHDLLLKQVIRDPSEQNINALDHAFREHYAEVRFVKYVSLVLYYEAVHFDQRQKKRQQRALLILDQPVKDETEETLVEQLTAQTQISEEIDDSLEEQISSQALYQALLTLTPKQKQVLELSYVKQMLDKDIAKHLGVSQQAVSQTRRSALKKLKKSLGGIIP